MRVTLSVVPRSLGRETGGVPVHRREPRTRETTMIERDELNGIFDQLTPEDFVLPSTAIASMPGRYEGPDVLDGFVEHQLHAVRLAFAMSDGWLLSTAVLAGPEGLRTFVADDDERLSDFLARVRSEATRVRAHWCFLATQT